MLNVLSAHAMVITEKFKTGFPSGNRYASKLYTQPITDDNLIEVSIQRIKNIDTKEVKYFVHILKGATFCKYENTNPHHWQNKVDCYRNFTNTQARAQEIFNNPKGAWLELKAIYKRQSSTSENNN